jgi:redox-sensitive bicupin YhaK (pirin superfamily)
MNEDRFAPGRGFGMHGHRDMEILTFVLEGALEHRDSLGHGAVLRPGEVQRMSAGRGIRHSEFNPSADEELHLYQIWLLPDRQGVEPGYEQRPFPLEGRRGRFQLVASPDGREGSMRIQQNAYVSLAALEPGQSLKQTLSADRAGWLQVLRGTVEVNGTPLSAGDAAMLEQETELTLSATESAEVLWFDLP